MPRVISKDGTPKDVKNLGWLLRHAREVQGFTIMKAIQPSKSEVILTARLFDGCLFVCSFAQLTVLDKWLKRPVFYGATLNRFGVQGVVKRNAE